MSTGHTKIYSTFSKDSQRTGAIDYRTEHEAIIKAVGADLAERDHIEPVSRPTLRWLAIKEQNATYDRMLKAGAEHHRSTQQLKLAERELDDAPHRFFSVVMGGLATALLTVAITVTMAEILEDTIAIRVLAPYLRGLGYPQFQASRLAADHATTMSLHLGFVAALPAIVMFATRGRFSGLMKTVVILGELAFAGGFTFLRIFDWRPTELSTAYLLLELGIAITSCALIFALAPAVRSAFDGQHEHQVAKRSVRTIKDQVERSARTLKEATGAWERLLQHLDEPTREAIRKQGASEAWLGHHDDQQVRYAELDDPPVVRLVQSRK